MKSLFSSPLWKPILILALLASLLNLHAGVVAQEDSADDAAVITLLNSMTAEEKVGQLFLVTFQGTDVGPGTPIYALLTEHHVGGVVLLAANDNFVAAPQTANDAYRLISDLQAGEWNYSQTDQVNPVTGDKIRYKYVPLFIGISQEGGGPGYDQILDGLTPLPSPMAIGATWDPSLAQQAGQVMGQELSALGFNLYLGPSLDVLDSVDRAASSEAQTRVFGGDPYWVAEMGRAYISGLHIGSNGRLLVAAKHFPGRGGADRSPQDEVATVRKSLEQLKQIELAPFFALTNGLPTSPESTDALLVSHIRYQGFQGNIRATTRPVSFDAQALGQILALQPFAAWRENGGLIICDDLGSRAVRQFYDPTGTYFQARLVARDALLAGNDLLYFGNIVSGDAPDTYTTVIRSLDYFANKYREDQAFASRVDDAVKRILRAKMRLYPHFLFSEVQEAAGNFDILGTSQQVTFEIARRAATLISPDIIELDTVLPEPPEARDRLVFITDSTSIAQCSTCPPQPTLAVQAFQQAVLRLYGSDKGGDVLAKHLSSYSFEDLSRMLEHSGGQALEIDLRRTDYVILSLVDSANDQARILRRFLSERQDLLRDKQIILFAFGAPFYLDATDISKLTAYYGLYSRTSAFVEVAVRLLYQELSPHGASPVSIPGIGYDLISATSPDPNQIIPLFLDSQPASVSASDSTGLTPEPTSIPLFEIGDTVAVRTGIILDHNGHPVPDGTVVRFSFVILGEGGGIVEQKEVVTVGGVGRASFKLDKPGLFEIRATSEPAVLSESLQLDVSRGVSAAVTVIVPFPPVTFEPMAESTPTPLETGGGALTESGYPRLGGWLIVIILLGIETWLSYWVGYTLFSPRWAVRWALCSLLGGLAIYNYLALGLPGSVLLVSRGGIMMVLGMTTIGLLLGGSIAWLWAGISHRET